MRRVTTILALSLAGLGCRDDGACDQAVDHVIRLILENVPAEMRADAEKKLAEEKPKMLEECKEKRSDTQCVLQAKRIDDVYKCKRRAR